MERAILRQSNALNLDVHVLGKSLDSNTAAGRLVREPLLVLSVHLGKVTHVGEEDGGLDNLGDGGARLLDDSLDVLAALGRLLGNGTLDEGAVRLQGNLAGAVDRRRGLDGLGLWYPALDRGQMVPMVEEMTYVGAKGRGGVLGKDDLLVGHGGLEARICC